MTKIVGCGHKFVKILVVDLSYEEGDMLKQYNVQPMFNVCQNNQLKCPNCSQAVKLVLESRLLIGNSEYFHYKHFSHMESIPGFSAINMNQSVNKLIHQEGMSMEICESKWMGGDRSASEFKDTIVAMTEKTERNPIAQNTITENYSPYFVDLESEKSTAEVKKGGLCKSHE